MDYPKSVPNVALVDGQFVDENATSGQIGSLIPASWANGITQEILNVIKAANIAPSEGDLSQLLKAIQAIAASDIKRTVQCATTGAIALSGLQTIDGVALAAGSRVLVKNQASAAQNWIYTVSAGAWVRALDANESAECTPGHLVIVEAGTVNAGSVWQLSNTTAPVLGTTALNFVRVLGKTGVTAGSFRQVTVDDQGRVTGGSNPTTVAAYGLTDVYTKTQVDTALSSKAASATTLGGYGIVDAYTRTAIDNLLSIKLAIADIGWGGVALDFPGNDLNTPLGRSGLYRTTYDALNIPPGATAQGGVVRHEVWGSGVFQQTFYEHVTGREWHRAINAEAFGGWLESTTNMAGAIVAFAMTSPPDGYLIANGATVSRVAYPTLFNRIGTRYGAGNGTTTFVLPDLRGEVIRGYDDGRGIDPGRGFGSVQLDALQGHGHQNTAQRNGSSGGTGEFLSHSNGTSSEQLTGRILAPINLSGYGSVRVATETRMRNIALLYCIKY